MKISFALAISASVLQGVKGCYQGIIPDYHFVNLTNSPHVSEETRAWANATYWHGRNLKHGRQQTGGGSDGEGITGSDDDDEFDEDQDPSDAADLRKETKALHEAAKNDTPDPGAVEDTNRRRWTGAVTQNGKRQATDRLRAVWTDNMGCAKSPSSTLVRTENSSPAVDADMNTLFDGIGKVDNLFRNVYGRNAISGTGGYYYGTGHYCVRFMNAYWDGVQLVFGDGDGEVFATNSFINSLDVIGHEIGHGVVEYSNPLFYNGQSGALNEHLADVFGSLTLQHSQTQSASQATWLIGQGVVVNATALRSMKAPGTAYNTPALGKDPQPANMTGYYAGAQDNYGVHINSGIPNKAFYQFAIGQGGKAYEQAGKIWYNVLTRNQGNFSYQGETFNMFAQKTVNAATALYGDAVARNLTTAWKSVGLL